MIFFNLSRNREHLQFIFKHLNAHFIKTRAEESGAKKKHVGVTHLQTQPARIFGETLTGVQRTFGPVLDAPTPPHPTPPARVCPGGDGEWLAGCQHALAVGKFPQPALITNQRPTAVSGAGMNGAIGRGDGRSASERVNL